MHIGDVVGMPSMNPITDAVLFSHPPSPETLGTKTAPLGSAAWPTWKPGAPDITGTILGPAGASVPGFSGLGDSPAPNGPTSFLSPMPSIVRPPYGATESTTPSVWCQLNTWVTSNPGIAAVVAVGIFAVLKNGGKKR